MASHGMFGKDGPRYRGKQGRKVNYQQRHNQHDDRTSYSQHDDRFESFEEGPADHGGGNYHRGNRGRPRGGTSRGRWTRGRGRGGGMGGDNDRQSYRGRGRGGGASYRGGRGYSEESQGRDSYHGDKGKNRYTPYTKSPPGNKDGRGNRRGSVFNRLGDQHRGNKGSVFKRLSGGRGDDHMDNSGPMRDRRVSFQRTEGEVMEEDTSSVLLQVLGGRYDGVNMSLDLSDMFHDKVLQDNNIRGCMFDNVFVSSILELVSSHCPMLSALNLSQNKLQRLQAYVQLKDKCPSLQALDLSNNEIRNIQELEVIAPMPSLTKLNLENNYFNDNMSDVSLYATSVRKYFPNLQYLNEQQLPGPIRFDLPTNTGSLPPTQKGYLVNEEVRSLVVSFLEQFYSLYDGETRDKLLEAYSDNAVFSFSVDMSNQQQPQRGPSFQYLHMSRNLVRVNDAAKRATLLKNGRIDIVQCLRQLPRTFHIASTFNVDVMKASPMCTGFTVYGLFGEISSNSKSDSHPIRMFSRTFIIVAAGTGVAIVNDHLTIKNANNETAKRYYNEVQSHFAQSTVPIQQQILPTQTLLPQRSLSPVGPYASQDELVQRLCLETGMNLEYSRKCLHENSWVYDKAIAAFRLFQNQGKIPSEAFQH